jgi:membrane fusion protein (multidrug efflux system)
MSTSSFSLTLGVVLLAGCARGTADSTSGPAKAKAIHVPTVAVGEQVVPKTLVLAGSLKANQESELAANASGRVVRTLVERGSYVARGAAIAQLDTRTAALTAAEAEAHAETARLQKKLADEECARFERLFRRGVITQQEYERQASSCKTAVTATAAAQARAQLSRQTLRDGTVRAPFAGLVSERYVSVGEYVLPATRIAHVVDIDPLRLVLTIPEQHLGAVRQGQTVGFRVGAFPGRTFSATVHYIGPAVRASTRDLVFEALVPNRDKLLRPGLFATARLEVGQEKLPVVPASALRADGDSTRAFAVVGKHVEERLVQLGPAVGERVAILKGLSAGERIVARPDSQVADGVEVE